MIINCFLAVLFSVQRLFCFYVCSDTTLEVNIFIRSLCFCSESLCFIYACMLSLLYEYTFVSTIDDKYGKIFCFYFKFCNYISYFIFERCLGQVKMEENVVGGP